MMKFAGSFYPNSHEEILKMFEHFNNILDNSNFDTSIYNIKPRIAIVPHAGYIYSGFTANVAFRILNSHEYKKAIVIGPSHHHYFKNISILKAKNYQTPLGDLKLYHDDNATFIPEAHNEHSTEVQMPFLKHYFPDIEVCEVVYGDIKRDALIPLIKQNLNDDTIVIISTDLSHFYNQQEANKLDKYCLHALANLDISYLQTCEACGKKGVSASIKIANELNLKSKVLDYRTSFDTSGDDKRVVGYMSGILF